MNLLFLILLAALIFILLLFLAVLRIKLVFDTDKSEINMTLLWLDPFVNAFMTLENTMPVLKVYLFKQLVIERTLSNRGRNKNGGIELVKLSNPKDVHVNVHYGFNDPFTTGITCGAINIASQFLNIASINQIPDFMPENDYIYLDATAKVILGEAVVNLLSERVVNKWLKLEE
jgi:hypothetical protein